MKLTVNINPHQPFIKNSQYFKLRIPKVHVEFFRILSESPSIINTYIDRRNTLFYSYQQWVSCSK